MSTDASWAKNFLESRRMVWVISVVILCLFALTNLPWQLDDYDQAQQAFTSFEMIKEGHWFFQRTPHAKVIAQKPPLVGWASADQRAKCVEIAKTGAQDGSWKATTPPGRTNRDSWRKTEAGSGSHIRMRRPTAATRSVLPSGRCHSQA
jgi:hypothetical protein